MQDVSYFLASRGARLRCMTAFAPDFKQLLGRCSRLQAAAAAAVTSDAVCEVSTFSITCIVMSILERHLAKLREVYCGHAE